ncbi:MAG: DUF362 domain-containing protein [Candidatus Omnitrophica bacterium]|nr:DUF362 domain-containing protein [Candidatus Omnitrophota bacterium]
MSKVYFASAHVKRLVAEDTLPPKFGRLLKKLIGKDVFKNQTVAIKMHLGGNVGFTTIRTLFVRMLVDKVKEAGGKTFITGGAEWVQDAKIRGYTEEVLGAPIYQASGIKDKYFYKRSISTKGRLDSGH